MFGCFVWFFCGAVFVCLWFRCAFLLPLVDRSDHEFYLFVSLGLVGCVNLFFLVIICLVCFCILLCFSRSLRLSLTCLSVLVLVCLFWRCLCLFLLVTCLLAVSAPTVVLCLFASLLDFVVLCCVFGGQY